MPFLISLLANKKLIYYGLIFAILGGLIFHHVYLFKKCNKLTHKLNMAQIENKELKKDRLENEKIHNETVKEISNLNDSLNDDLARLHKTKSKCIKISYPTKPNNDTTPRTKLSERNGISDKWLYGFAGRCEQTRINLIGTQAFIRKTQQKFND